MRVPALMVVLVEGRVEMDQEPLLVAQEILQLHHRPKETMVVQIQRVLGGVAVVVVLMPLAQLEQHLETVVVDQRPLFLV